MFAINATLKAIRELSDNNTLNNAKTLAGLIGVKISRVSEADKLLSLRQLAIKNAPTAAGISDEMHALGWTNKFEKTYEKGRWLAYGVDALGKADSVGSFTLYFKEDDGNLRAIGNHLEFYVSDTNATVARRINAAVEKLGYADDKPSQVNEKTGEAVVTHNGLVSDADNALFMNLKPARPEKKNGAPDIVMDAKESTKLLKAILKKAFPDTKFSIKLERIVMLVKGVIIEWVDGASEGMVERITEHFKGGDRKAYYNAKNQDGKIVAYSLGNFTLSRTFTKAFLGRVENIQPIEYKDKITIKGGDDSAYFDIADYDTNRVVNASLVRYSESHYGSISNLQSENQDVSGTQSSLESDSGTATIGEPVGGEIVSPTRPNDGLGVGQSDGGTGSAGLPVGGTDDLFNGSPVVGGTDSDSGVRGGKSLLSGGNAKRGGRGGGSNDRVDGERTERTTAGAIAGTATENALISDKYHQQVKAESIPVKLADMDNVRHTLPFLQEGQQDDVFKAEKRFEEGEGMLFTNGTGTGKTFSGLGVIKRFDKQGKHNILILAPSQDIMKDWIKSGKNLGLNITDLEGISDAGQGIVITTYANLGANAELAKRDWDLVVADESHKLMTNGAGAVTEALSSFKAITNHPNGNDTRARMILHKEYVRMVQIQNEMKLNRLSDDERDWSRNNALELEYSKLLKLTDARKSELVEQYKNAPRSKVVMLSATPFAYVKNVDYAEGYLFDYAREKDGQAYNSGDGREQFFMQHFGYRMRYNKLTQPDANVNSEVMEREFNEYLQKTGALSGRHLDVDQDYERSFALVDDAIGEKIDEGLEWLRTAHDSRYQEIYAGVIKKFDYLARMRLLEALKARHAVGIIKKNLALGRKVVVFHDYNEGGALTDPFNNFTFSQDSYGEKDGSTIKAIDLLAEAKAERPDIFSLDIGGLQSAINTIKTAFPTALIYNGTVANKLRTEAKRVFNDDGLGIDVILVQSAAGEAGISLHDTTGKQQRIILNLGMPTRPTTAIQQEGRIYRVGQKSDAIFKYMNTGTTWERQTFADKISERASTVENLALGNEARTLKQSFIDAFVNSDYYEPNEGEGKGGKEADKATGAQISPFEKAKSFYFGQQKNSKKRLEREGTDYYATPEPVGFKMVEFGGVKSGDKLLEPSAGHGAISRFFPEQNVRTLVEQSPDLASRASLSSNGAKVITGSFEHLHITNKYDVIVMNPPYGSAGKMAIDHVEKAATHLRNGGRIVALIPRGKADSRLSAFLGGDGAGKDLHMVADIILPSSTFERAGTGVMTHIVVLEKQTDKESADKLRSKNVDLSNAENIKDLFDRLEHISIPPRVEPVTKEVSGLSEGETVTYHGANFRVENEEVTKLAMMERVAMPLYTRISSLTYKHLGDMNREKGKQVITFRSTDSLNAFLADFAKEAEAKPVVSGGSPAQGSSTPLANDILTAGEFPHSKTGAMVYVASINTRVDKDVYRDLQSKAGEFGGYFSSFNKYGAISGFHFKSTEMRDAFITKVTGKEVAVFDSIPSDYSLGEILALIKKLSSQKDDAVAGELAKAIGVSIVKPSPTSKTAETVEKLLSSPVLKAANLLTGKETIDEAKKQGALFYKELIANPITSPALGNDITFDQRGWDYITNEGYAKQFDPKKKRSDNEVRQRISLLPKAKEVIANAVSIEGEPRTEHGSTRFALLGRFDDGEAIRVILERREGEDHYFLSVFDLARESKQLRKSSLPTSTLSGAPSVQGKATDASDSANIPQPQTKTITIKVPVSANSLSQYAPKAYGDLSQLTESDFLNVWKYINAANYMLRNSIEVSDAKHANRHILSQAGKPELVKMLNDELVKRGLDKKYTLFVERKEKPQFDDIGSFNFTPAISFDATLQAIKNLAENNTPENAKQLAALIGVKLKESEPIQELDMFGDPIQTHGFDLFGDPIQDGDESPVEELPRLAIQELPLNKLTLSDDVPQFKSGAEDDTGVVEALGGKFDRTGVAPIQVWERTDGRLEIISGRHRTDLARRSGEKTIPAQVHKEADGFTAKQAMMLDAELNIRDGQGKVKDYVDYFTHSEISEDEADKRGLLARHIGKRAFTIASQGSEELLTLHRNDIISDQAAAEIAAIVPNNSAMQAVGLRVLQEHKPLNNALNTIRAVMALTREKGQEPDTFDLFGFDDSALKEAEAMAKIASRKQRLIAEQLTAIKGAVKNPKLAAKHGVIVENEADALEKVKTMTVQKARWDNWSSHADLLAEVRAEINTKLDSLADDDDYWYWYCQEEEPLTV